MRIKCPWCGERYLAEFSYQGDATVIRPKDPNLVSDHDWYNYVYLRDNPKGWHDEIWHHIQGCRKHFKIRRNVVTHEIAASVAMTEDLIGGEK